MKIEENETEELKTLIGHLEKDRTVGQYLFVDNASEILEVIWKQVFQSSKESVNALYEHEWLFKL